MYESYPQNDDFDAIIFSWWSKIDFLTTNIFCEWWYCILLEQWFNCLHVYKYNVRRINVYFNVSINWRSKQYMWSQNIENEYFNFGSDIHMIVRREIDSRLYYYIKKDKTVDRSFVDYLKIGTLFNCDWSFCQPLRSIDCWWLGKQWTGWYWAYGPNFLDAPEKLDDE